MTVQETGCCDDAYHPGLRGSSRQNVAWWLRLVLYFFPLM